MQKVQVIGNIVRDAQIREVNNRKAINFVVAVNESYKNKEGVKVDKATFWSCTHWKDGSQSTEVVKYLTKGIKVYVEGVPSAELYTKKDRSTGIDYRVNVNLLNLLTFPDKKEGEATTTETHNAVPTGSVSESEGDDLPF